MRRLAILLTMTFAAAVGAQDAPLPEQSDSDIGYESPAAALTALKNKPGVKLKVEDQWYLFWDQAEATMWSIARLSNPAYPSAVKRKLISREGSMFVAMQVICGASKENCDQMVREFKQLNEDMAAKIRDHKAK